jgi:hypothetical protein
MNRLRHVIGLPIEYAMKATAATAGLLSLGAEGGLVGKTLAGYRSIPATIGELRHLPGKLTRVTELVNDYNTQTAREFTTTYGGDVIQMISDNLNGLINYGTQVAENFQTAPLTTLSAAGIAFLGAYGFGRATRFWRQKGQGSFVQKFERDLGDRVFTERPRASPSATGQVK